MSHVVKCNQTEIRKELPGPQASRVNSFLRETRVNCVAIYIIASGFGGLGVACWPLVPKFAVSYPAEAVGVLGRKNPQHAFLRRVSKAIGPMS